MWSNSPSPAIGINLENEEIDPSSLSSQTCRLILSPPEDAFTNMALDEALARNAINVKDWAPTFRIYYWNSPSVSIGYFQRAKEVLDALTLSTCRDTLQHVPTVVRRPTGGTAVLHDNQPSFSLVIGRPVEVRQFYRLLGQVVIKALKSLGLQARLWGGKGDPTGRPYIGSRTANVQEEDSTFPLKIEAGGVSSPLCTSNLSPNDVISQGQKVAGYSARRLRGVTLFQGYLHLPGPIRSGLPSKKLKTHHILGGGGRGCVLVEALVMGMEKLTRLRLKEGSPTESETLLAQELVKEKYLQRDWNFKR
jgi:lipoate-protein ligase A